MSEAMAKRRAGRGRRWMEDRRLWSNRRIEDIPLDGPNQRTGERQSNADRRIGNRRAA